MTKKASNSIFLSSGCLRPAIMVAFLKGSLDPSRSELLTLHLKECPFCRDALDGMQGMNHPADFEKNLAMLQKKISRQHFSLSSSSTYRINRVALAAAASLLLILGSFGLWRMLLQPAQKNTPIAQLTPQNTGALSQLQMPKKLMAPKEARGSKQAIARTRTKTEMKVTELPSEAPVKSEYESEIVSPQMGAQTEIPAEESTPKDPVSGQSVVFHAQEKGAGPSAGIPDFYYNVDEMPRFHQGDLSLFRDYVQRSLRYPREALREGLEGTVYISFIVNPDGMVFNVSVLQGVNPLMDEEALRVIKASPPWKPGKNKGKRVNVGYILPVKFQLE